MLSKANNNYFLISEQLVIKDQNQIRKGFIVSEWNWQTRNLLRCESRRVCVYCNRNVFFLPLLDLMWVTEILCPICHQPRAYHTVWSNHSWPVGDYFAMFFQLTKTSSICSTLTHRNAWQRKRSVHTGLRVCVVAADQHGLVCGERRQHCCEKMVCRLT